jgi:hypothetical protein
VFADRKPVGVHVDGAAPPPAPASGRSPRPLRRETPPAAQGDLF